MYAMATKQLDGFTDMTQMGHLQSMSKEESVVQMEPDGPQTIEPCISQIHMEWLVSNIKANQGANVLRQIIWAYDFDPAHGTISNKRIFVDRRNQIGEPDGLVVDVEGNVYTFLWGGARAAKYNPRGELLKEWDINAHRVTHGAWVGKDFNELILTSAMTEDSSKLWEGEEGGALFWLKDVGCVGMKKHKFGRL